MRQSQIFTKTSKEAPADEPSKNAELLARGGFVYKNSAGIYSFLPLGWRVIEKINKIIREEMNAIGGIEMFMPALVERKYLEATNRFNLDIGFDVFAKNEKCGTSDVPHCNVGHPMSHIQASYALGWTHEEVLTHIVSKYVNSYKDLPLALYQIQTKFRNEARPKSGLLRGREFLMKDLYRFHRDEKDLFLYYEKVKEAYFKVFERCGLNAFYTMASGGDFTISNTHEFQVLADVGEDEIFYCKNCHIAENKEMSKLEAGGACRDCGGKIERGNAIEVGNIFPLGTKYAEAFDLKYTDEQGAKKLVVMGSYGIGVSRLMGTLAEVYHDERGIIWPKAVAPYQAHLLYLVSGNNEVKSEADKLYKLLQKSGVEVLYDDRTNVTAGEKFADADLLGMPWRIVVSEKTLQNASVELKSRNANNFELCSKEFSVIFPKISG